MSQSLHNKLLHCFPLFIVFSPMKNKSSQLDFDKFFLGTEIYRVRDHLQMDKYHIGGGIQICTLSIFGLVFIPSPSMVPPADVLHLAPLGLPSKLILTCSFIIR